MAARSLKKKWDLRKAVLASMGNAIKQLHRTQHKEKPSFHQMPVCVCCDNFIIGTERVHRIAKKTLKKYEPALGVKSYNAFHNESLHPLLIKQYKVKGLDGMLLSPRANKNKKGYSICTSCYSCLKKKKPSSKVPPKFAIANGFAIGSFPKVIPVATGPRRGRHRKINTEDENDVSDVMRTLISPVRPYGYVIAYTGGKHAQIKGHYQFFEMNMERTNAGMHALSQNETNVHVMLCGPMTKDQKSKVKSMALIDTQKYVDIMTWLIRNSAKESIREIPLPQHCFVPKIYDDSTDARFEPGEKRDEKTKETEKSFGGGTYYFSSAHTPSHYTGVFQSTKQFAEALLRNNSPRLFVYGGNRVRPHEADLEDILPLAFPFGTGGPTFKRRVKVSVEECIKNYMRLALQQFMRSDVIFVMQHAYSRTRSYKTGLIRLRSKIGGRETADIIGNTSSCDFLRSIQQRNQHPSDPMFALTNAVSTTCEVLGYTEEAAKRARQNCFAMTDHFGLSSLFMSTTPCDECSFRVRLYSNPKGMVSSNLTDYIPSNQTLELISNIKELPDVSKLSEEECALDFTIRRQTRKTYPGACSLEFQNTMDIVLRCLLNWDSDKKERIGTGIVGDLDGWAQTGEEQGRGSLHAHWQLFTEQLSTRVRFELFHRDKLVRDTARKELADYIDNMICASYGSELDITHACDEPQKSNSKHEIYDKEAKEMSSPGDAFYPRHPQIFRDARHKMICNRIDGELITCGKCGGFVRSCDIPDNFYKEQSSKRRVSHCFFSLPIHFFLFVCINADKRIIHSLQPQQRTRLSHNSTVPPGSVPTKNQRDIAAYTHSYDLYGKRRINDEFWRDPKTRKVITKERFEFHDPKHRLSCFKKNAECRALFPKMPHSETILDDQSTGDPVTFHRLVEGEEVQTEPWLIYPKRPMGCEYINQHSYAVSEVLNCNSNIQIGDPTHVFYSTLYTSKSTQDDDANRQKRIAMAIVRRLIRQERMILSGKQDRIPSGFAEGISRMLCGLNAAVCRDVVSAPMAHLLICQDGKDSDTPMILHHYLCTK